MTQLKKTLEQALAVALAGTTFKYDDEQFMIETVELSGGQGELQVEASCGAVNASGQRIIFFTLRIENLEDDVA